MPPRPCSVCSHMVAKWVMSVSTQAERDLVLALNRQPHDPGSRQVFVDLLRQYTGASAACLQMRFGPTTPLRSLLSVSTDNTAPAALDLEGPWPTDLTPVEALRPNRVYALHELLSPDGQPDPQIQRDAMRLAGLADARLMRVGSSGGHEAVLMVTSARTPFDARDAALLSGLAPHVLVALENTAHTAIQHARMAMAERTLAQLGIGQVALDASGRVVLADDHASQELRLRAGARAPLTPAALLVLRTLATTEGPEDPAERLVATSDAQAGGYMLLQPSDQTDSSHIAAVGVFRSPQDLDRPLQARILAKLLGLSEREAALADALSRGQSILEAGEALRLTPETARNYTKRAYAKTGARGQADLVRLVLTSLASLT